MRIRVLSFFKKCESGCAGTSFFDDEMMNDAQYLWRGWSDCNDAPPTMITAMGRNIIGFYSMNQSRALHEVVILLEFM